MWDSLLGVFNWQWVLGSLGWSVLGTIVVKAWFWLTGKEFPRRKAIAFWVIAPLSFFLLILMVTSMSTVGHRSQFNASVQAVTFGTLGPPEKVAFVMPTVNIKNTGAPSLAEAFKLTVQFANGTTQEGKLVTLSEHLTLTYSSGITEDINYADQLHVRAFQPIQTGGAEVGRLLFEFPNTSEETMKSQATGVVLTFQDVRGTQYTATGKFTGETAEALAIPGLHPSVKTPTPKK